MRKNFALFWTLTVVLAAIFGGVVVHFSQPKIELPLLVVGESSPFLPLAQKVQMVSPRSSSGYSAGDKVAQGEIELFNRGEEPFALALWVSPGASTREPSLEIAELQAALLREGYGPPRPLSSPNDLVLFPGEQYLLTFAVRVSPLSSVGEIGEIDVNINHLTTCESKGKVVLCPGKG